MLYIHDSKRKSFSCFVFFFSLEVILFYLLLNKHFYLCMNIGFAAFLCQYAINRKHIVDFFFRTKAKSQNLC